MSIHEHFKKTLSSRTSQHYEERTLHMTTSHFLFISLPGSCNKIFQHMPPPKLHNQKINTLFNVGPSQSIIFHFQFTF
jgi:hypothetical protein